MTEPNPPQADPPADDKAQAETAFWDRFRKEVHGVIDERLEKWQKDRSTGTQRTGRTTIFDVIGDFMWGTKKPTNTP